MKPDDYKPEQLATMGAYHEREVTEVVAGEMLSSQKRRLYGIAPGERFWLARKNR